MKLRTLAAVVACVAMIAGVVATILRRELPAGRELAAETHRSIDPAPEPLRAAERDTGSSPTSQPSADASMVRAVASPEDAASWHQSGDDHDLLLHPYHREVRRAELRKTIEQGYPGLVEELELTPVESDQFFGLLAEGRVAIEAEAYIFDRDPVDLMAAAQATRNRQLRQRQQNEAVKTLLGNDRHARWQAYQQNQGAWLQAGAYGTALARSGAPLDGPQTRVIALAMIEERQHHRGRDQSGQRVLDAVAPHLSDQQLQLLRDQMALQDAGDRATAR